jgi:diguanylate cyclase (GGDEF)-like protein
MNHDQGLAGQLRQSSEDFAALLARYSALERRHESLAATHAQLVQATQALAGGAAPARQQAAHTLLEATWHDELTGLPNMALLSHKAEQQIALAWQGGTRVALLVIELDGVLPLAQTQGAGVLAAVLQTSANRLLQVIRGCDQLARSGPCTFTALMLGPKNDADLAPIAQRMLGALTQTLPQAQDRLVSAAHIGCAFFPSDGTDVPTLLEHAAVALSVARQEGGNSCRSYSLSMPDRLSPPAAA